MGEAGESFGVMERAIAKRRIRARGLMEGHEAHDPEAIRQIQDIYGRASYKAGRWIDERARVAREKARDELRALDEAGFACDKCAPMSACELEKTSVPDRRVR